MIEELAQKKEQTKVSPARVNRLLALLRSILNKAERKWKWCSWYKIGASFIKDSI